MGVVAFVSPTLFLVVVDLAPFCLAKRNASLKLLGIRAMLSICVRPCAIRPYAGVEFAFIVSEWRSVCTRETYARKIVFRDARFEISSVVCGLGPEDPPN